MPYLPSALRFPIAVAALVITGLAGPCGAARTAQAAPNWPAMRFLDSGADPDLREEVPVQFVFVGYSPAQIAASDFLAALPETYDPVVRSRLWYGVTEPIGIHYTYDYSVFFADAAYQNAFFAALSAMAVKESAVDGKTRTDFQDQYNAQTRNVLDVGENYFIDAPSVEKWLIDHPPAGVDTRLNTVFFVNWWGRPDFKFHTYVKLGEPDPDTNYDFGLQRQSRKIIAWGGTTPADEETGLGSRGVNRIWFYDLSAGPESWTDNWNVDDADVDGDGKADYRMPPVWEYVSGGYRSPALLTGDLGKVARYVAINLLFTSSPLYPPYITPDRQPSSINLDVNGYEGWSGVSTSTSYEKLPLLVSEVGEVHRIPYNADIQPLPFEGEARRCYTLWVENAPCYPNRPYPAFANLFVYNALNIASFRDGGGEYEGMFFNYATEDSLAPGFLGFADDNWIDGTQSGTFNFISPGVVALGYGLTTTQIHEYGHHFGMSHPHDGYDSETGVDYGPEGEYYFAWSGDEENSMMSYIDLNWDYGQFDQDNANRFQASAYIRSANRILADILAAPYVSEAARDLRDADALVGAAEEAMAEHDYRGAFDNAKLGYEKVRSAAAKAGVTVTASTAGWLVLDPVRGPKPARKRAYSYIDKVGPGTHRSRP